MSTAFLYHLMLRDVTLGFFQQYFDRGRLFDYWHL